MVNQSSVGIAIAGAGVAGQLHAAGVRACSAAKLIGIYDPKAEQTDKIARQFETKAARSLDELLDDPAVDAVIVATPMEFHREPAVRAMNAGKAVLVEKPVGASVADAQLLVEAAKSSGQLCVPGHNVVYTPGVRQMREHIDAGDYGQIVALWILYAIHHPPAVAARYPGILRQIATHHFYSLLYLLGAPKRFVTMVTETREVSLDREDQYALVAEMPGGALANLFATFATNDQTNDPFTFRYKALGTEGGGTFSWRDSVSTKQGVGMDWRYTSYEESFVYEIDYFVRQCLLNGQPPLSTMDDAVTAQRLIEAAEESIRSGRVIDFAP
jgi:predicted dehydrogenase